MPVSADTLRKLMDAGLSGDALLDVVASIDADNVQKSRSNGAERQARYRAKKASTVTSDVTRDVTKSVTPPPDKEIPPTPPKETNPSSLPNGSSAPRDRAALDRLQAELLEAAGIGGFRDEKSPGLMNLAPILALLDRSYSLEADILPAIRDKCRGGWKPRTWGYFTDLIVERAAARNSIPAKQAAPDEDWPGRMKVWAEGTWVHGWGPKPGEPGCRVPAQFLSRAAA